MESVEVAGQMRHPGQVNNVYIFPGMSFGAICCEASSIPERFFMVAAEAVANSLSEEDIKSERVVPSLDRIREVGLNVAVAVVLEAQKMGLAGKNLGSDSDQVQAALKDMMWAPGKSEFTSNAGYPSKAPGDDEIVNKEVKVMGA